MDALATASSPVGAVMGELRTGIADPMAFLSMLEGLSSADRARVGALEGVHDQVAARMPASSLPLVLALLSCAGSERSGPEEGIDPDLDVDDGPTGTFDSGDETHEASVLERESSVPTEEHVDLEHDRDEPPPPDVDSDDNLGALLVAFLRETLAADTGDTGDSEPETTRASMPSPLEVRQPSGAEPVEVRQPSGPVPMDTDSLDTGSDVEGVPFANLSDFGWSYNAGSAEWTDLDESDYDALGPNGLAEYDRQREVYLTDYQRTDIEESRKGALSDEMFGIWLGANYPKSEEYGTWLWENNQAAYWKWRLAP